MYPAIAVLLGAALGGFLSVIASWLGQRLQSRSQLLAQEIKRRELLYSEFLDSSARCYADALQENEPDPGSLSRLYGEIGRMRLRSSDRVVKEAYGIVHKILDAYGESNRSKGEIREFFAHDPADIFARFAEACRDDLIELESGRMHM